jgi:hypothetical protein
MIRFGPLSGLMAVILAPKLRRFFPFSARSNVYL